MNAKIKGAELPEKEKWNRTFLQICTFVQQFHRSQQTILVHGQGHNYFD